MLDRDGSGGVASETSSSSSSSSSSSFAFLTQIPKILIESLKIFLRNKRTFLSIFALTTLPLAALLAAVSISSRPLRSRVASLETLARVASTRFEARQVWKESRNDAVTLLYAKSLILIPCLALSLLASVTAVSSAVIAVNGKRPTLLSAVSAVKTAWKRPLATSILVHAILLAYAHALRTLIAADLFPGRGIILAVGSGIEIYLMAVMSLAIVVSIAEDRLGAEAIRVGSDLVEGKRFSAWVLSGLFAWASGRIAGRLEKEAMLMDGQDLSQALRSTVAIIGENVWLVVLYGLVVLLSYVVFTVFYCECCRGVNSKRRYGRSDSEIETVTV